MDLKAIKRSKVFIPEFMGNKKGKVESQIKVNYKKFISGGEIGLYKTFRMIGQAVEVVYHDIEMMIACVDSLENLSIGGYVIDDAVKLCDFEDSRLYDLIVEIRKDLMKDAEELEQGE